MKKIAIVLVLVLVVTIFAMSATADDSRSIGNTVVYASIKEAAQISLVELSDAILEEHGEIRIIEDDSNIVVGLSARDIVKEGEEVRLTVPTTPEGLILSEAKASEKVIKNEVVSNWFCEEHKTAHKNSFGGDDAKDYASFGEITNIEQLEAFRLERFEESGVTYYRWGVLVCGCGCGSSTNNGNGGNGGNGDNSRDDGDHTPSTAGGNSNKSAVDAYVTNQEMAEAVASAVANVNAEADVVEATECTEEFTFSLFGGSSGSTDNGSTGNNGSTGDHGNGGVSIF